MHTKLHLVLILLQIHQSFNANILTIIPTASKTHHLPFQPLWRELALRGHQITTITTDPQHLPHLTNLKEIDTSYCYQIYDKYQITQAMADENKTYFQIAATMRNAFIECEDHHFNHPEIKPLLQTTNKSTKKFDLLMIEAQMITMFAFSWIYPCPVIGIASMDAALQFHDTMGNLVHPLTTPDYNLDVPDPEEMTFQHRATSFLYTNIYKYFIYKKVYPNYHSRIKRYFGDDLPPLEELQKNISMLFVGTNPLFHSIRPIGPNTITVGGGMHLKPAEKLPEDIQKFLDQGHRGVIYFSLGSNVNSNILTPEFKRALIDTFAELPYPVVMKMDADIGPVTENVLVKKWLPQQDILRHGNVKLFITQGGLQSLQESVYNGIPLIGIPFFGDQITNVNKMVKRGYGLKVDKRSLTKQSLKAAIEEVMRNESYREAARTMGEIFRDEEIPSLQRAVYWTEYVIRHKGAKHLRSPAADMPAWKYYMLDVLGFLVVLVAILAWGILWLMRCAIVWSWRKIFGSKPKRTKKKKGD